MRIQKQNINQPYRVVKNKKSLARILSSEFLKLLKIDPSTVSLLLQAKGFDGIQLRIKENSINKVQGNDAIPAGSLTLPAS